MDEAFRLSQLNDGLSTVNYSYNGDGVRVAQIADGIRTDYVQDVSLPLPQLLTAEQGGTINRYLRGLGLIGEQQGTAWQYHLPDALGSVRQLTDPQGHVVLAQHFDPFGAPTIVNRKSKIVNRYGFAGEEQDAGGHVFLRARTYNPETGRFLQSDPVLGTPDQPRTLHHYAYAFNNPVNYTDPSGLMPPGSYNRSANGDGAAPPHNYRGQQVSAFNPFTRGSGSRSANSGGIPIVRASIPNNYTRAQSQGHRPRTCGISDIVMGFGKAALNGDLLNEAFGFAKNGREIALEIMPMEYWELGFQLAVGFSPYDWAYDAASLMAGHDILTGEELTNFDKGAILLGFLTFGTADDFIDVGQKLARKNGIDSLPSLYNFGLKNMARGAANAFKGGIKGLLKAGEGLDKSLSGRLRRALDSLSGVGRMPTPDPGRPSGLLRRIEKAKQGAKAVSDRLAAVGRGDFGGAARQSDRGIPGHTPPLFNKYPASAGLDLGSVPRLRPMSLSEELASRVGDVKKSLDNFVRQTNDIAKGAIVGGLGMGGLEITRQSFTNEEYNWRDVGLATLTGAVLGGSIPARRIVANESSFEAFIQVGGGMALNIALSGNTETSDIYFAALYGGLAAPVTRTAEKRYSRLISNQAWGERIADAVTGAALTGSQYVVSNKYKGEQLTISGVSGNFIGGAIGGGVASFAPEIRTPWRQVNSVANDFIVPGMGTVMGSYYIPHFIEWLTDNNTND